MANDKHCKKCGQFPDTDGNCTSCNGLSSIIPGKGKSSPWTEGKNLSKYRKKLDSLTKDDWRIIREIGERIHRGFKGVAFKKGDTYFAMVNKKIVTLTGSYPYGVELIFSFRSHEKQIEYFKKIEESFDE